MEAPLKQHAYHSGMSKHNKTIGPLLNHTRSSENLQRLSYGSHTTTATGMVETSGMGKCLGFEKDWPADYTAVGSNVNHLGGNCLCGTSHDWVMTHDSPLVQAVKCLHKQLRLQQLQQQAGCESTCGHQ
jgi:hypothetical protein